MNQKQKEEKGKQEILLEDFSCYPDVSICRYSDVSLIAFQILPLISNPSLKSTTSCTTIVVSNRSSH